MLNNLKIGSRLALGFGLLLALLCVMAATAAWEMGSLVGNTRYYAQNLVPSYESEHGLSIQLDDMRRAELEHVLASSPTEMDEQERRIGDSRERVGQTLDRYAQQLVSNEQDKRHLETVRAALGDYYAQWDPVRALSRQTATDPSKEAEARRLLEGPSAQAFDSLRAAVDAWWAYNVQLAHEEAAHSDAVYDRARLGLFGMVALALGLGLGASVLITRSIVRPVRRAVEVAATVARGDLTSRFDTGGRDEMAELMRALARMNDSLVGIVGQVRASSDSIATGSSQIALGNADLSQRTESQASSLEQTAASMEEISGTVRSNAETADQARRLASDATQAATHGGELVDNVVNTMQAISQASGRIAEIIGVIDGIAFQTNILALNAAVEAARAGEQGRGFAVVAGEVRTLAKRSAEAAREIKELIGANVVQVEMGGRHVNDAGASMQDIVAKVRRVNEMIAEIASATGEQSTGIGQIGEAVSHLDQVTQQNAALVEESAAAAESLRVQAAQLAEVVSVFRCR